MSDELDPLAWAAKAEEDYKLAVSALRRKQPLTEFVFTRNNTRKNI